jgi:hypothetical protein
MHGAQFDRHLSARIAVPKVQATLTVDSPAYDSALVRGNVELDVTSLWNGQWQIRAFIAITAIHRKEIVVTGRHAVQTITTGTVDHGRTTGIDAVGGR